jgi:hypothetical protein
MMLPCSLHVRMQRLCRRNKFQMGPAALQSPCRRRRGQALCSSMIVHAACLQDMHILQLLSAQVCSIAQMSARPAGRVFHTSLDASSCKQVVQVHCSVCRLPAACIVVLQPACGREPLLHQSHAAAGSSRGQQGWVQLVSQGIPEAGRLAAQGVLQLNAKTAGGKAHVVPAVQASGPCLLCLCLQESSCGTCRGLASDNGSAVLSNRQEVTACCSRDSSV